MLEGGRGVNEGCPMELGSRGERLRHNDGHGESSDNF